jgi:hypothetical protein
MYSMSITLDDQEMELPETTRGPFSSSIQRLLGPPAELDTT